MYWKYAMSCKCHSSVSTVLVTAIPNSTFSSVSKSHVSAEIRSMQISTTTNKMLVAIARACWQSRLHMPSRQCASGQASTISIVV
jgi:hypothetical protein